MQLRSYLLKKSILSSWRKKIIGLDDLYSRQKIYLFDLRDEESENTEILNIFLSH